MAPSAGQWAQALQAWQGRGTPQMDAAARWQLALLQLHFFLTHKVTQSANSVPGPLSTPKQSCHPACWQQNAFRLRLCKLHCGWVYVIDVKFLQFPYKAEAISQHSWPCHESSTCPTSTCKNPFVHLQWHKPKGTSNNSCSLLQTRALSPGITVTVHEAASCWQPPLAGWRGSRSHIWAKTSQQGAMGGSWCPSVCLWKAEPNKPHSSAGWTPLPRVTSSPAKRALQFNLCLISHDWLLKKKNYSRTVVKREVWCLWPWLLAMGRPNRRRLGFSTATSPSPWTP